MMSPSVLKIIGISTLGLVAFTLIWISINANIKVYGLKNGTVLTKRNIIIYVAINLFLILCMIFTSIVPFMVYTFGMKSSVPVLVFTKNTKNANSNHHPKSKPNQIFIQILGSVRYI